MFASVAALMNSSRASSAGPALLNASTEWRSTPRTANNKKLLKRPSALAQLPAFPCPPLLIQALASAAGPALYDGRHSPLSPETNRVDVV